MNANKKIARIVGVLFIIGTVAGVLSVFLTGHILGASDYLIKVSENESKIIIGALLILVMWFALAMIPVIMFPIFKKYNEVLALGAVLFRGALEAVAYIAIVISLLMLLTLSQKYVNAETQDVSNVQTLGSLILETIGWLSHIVSIVFSLGALMIYYLFYISKLIPRWLSVWGILGGIIYLTEPLLAIFGSEFQVLFVPLAVQEMVFAIWLLVKGFNPTKIT